METKTQAPSFTVSLRGYDRDEVDEYLDSMASALGHADDAEEHNRRLQAHINKLNARIKDLEDRIRSDSPRTGAVLGERIGLLLREAEDAASETVSLAEVRAADILSAAEAKAAEAEETLRSAVSRGEEQARRLEAAARGEAADIVAEAEARSAARTRQIEQWAEQVVSHTRAEEARMLSEHQEKRRAAYEELRALGDEREKVALNLTELRDALGRALDLIPEEAADGAALMVSVDAGEGVAAGEGGAVAGEGGEAMVLEPEVAAAALHEVAEAVSVAELIDLDSEAEQQTEEAQGPVAEQAQFEVAENGAAGFSPAGDGVRVINVTDSSPASAETQSEKSTAATTPTASEGAETAAASVVSAPSVHQPSVDRATVDRATGGTDEEWRWTDEVEVINVTHDEDSGVPKGDEHFEAKLEAWVTGSHAVIEAAGEPKHYKR